MLFPEAVYWFGCASLFKWSKCIINGSQGNLVDQTSERMDPMDLSLVWQAMMLRNACLLSKSVLKLADYAIL